MTYGRAGRSCRAGRSSPGPSDAAGGGRSPRPLGSRWATRAMTRPLGEGLPSPGPPFAMSRRHVTPAAAGREAAQDCRYGRGAGEERSGSPPGTESGSGTPRLQACAALPRAGGRARLGGGYRDLPGSITGTSPMFHPLRGPAGASPSEPALGTGVRLPRALAASKNLKGVFG